MVRSQDDFIFKNMPKFDMRKSDPEIQNQIKSFWVSRSTANLVPLDNTDGLNNIKRPGWVGNKGRASLITVFWIIRNHCLSKTYFSRLVLILALESEVIDSLEFLFEPRI